MPYTFNPAAVKKLREGLGLSISEFAERIGISRQAAYELESCDSEKRPNIRTIEKIMSVFRASPLVFFVDDHACVQDHKSI